MQLTIAGKIYIGIGGLAVVLVILALFAQLTIRKTAAQLQHIHESAELVDQLGERIADHFLWAQSLAAESIMSGREFTGQLDPTQCKFGKWYHSYTPGRELETAFKKIEEPHRHLHATAAKITLAVKEGKLDAARTVYREETLPLLSETQAAIRELKSAAGKTMKEENRRTAAVQARMGTVSLIVYLALLGVLVAGALVFIARPIKRELSHLNEQVELLASGDMRAAIESNGTEEIRTLAENLNKMVLSFRGAVGSIISAANSVVQTVDAVQKRTDKTTEGARNQSLQASQIATAAEEMSQTITDIARNASVASDSSTEAMETAAKGKEVAEGAVTTTNSVYTATVELSSMVQKLNNRVGEIGDIVTVIKDIADQTNLLALNAAIEAARAGEQGQGFAVVADEVRRLAERTIKATAEISDKIGAVQAESAQTARSMGDASGKVTEATGSIRQVGDSLTHIVGSVEKVRDQILQIATAVDQQSAASEQVAKSIEKTSEIAKDMERMADEVAHEIIALSRIAEALRSSTAGFTIAGA